MHEPICRRFDPIGAAEQSLDFAPIANNKSLVAPLKERRPPEEQAVGRDSQAKIALAAFCQRQR
jgi:hypothetical protein